MDNNQFWFRLSALVAFVIVCAVGGCTANETYDDYLIAGMVAKGTHPIAARCAIYGPGGTDVGRALICMEAAKK